MEKYTVLCKSPKPAPPHFLCFAKKMVNRCNYLTKYICKNTWK